MRIYRRIRKSQVVVLDPPYLSPDEQHSLLTDPKGSAAFHNIAREREHTAKNMARHPCRVRDVAPPCECVDGKCRFGVEYVGDSDDPTAVIIGRRTPPGWRAP